MNSLNMCDLVKETVQVYSILGIILFWPLSQNLKQINSFQALAEISFRTTFEVSGLTNTANRL